MNCTVRVVQVSRRVVKVVQVVYVIYVIQVIQVIQVVQVVQVVQMVQVVQVVSLDDMILENIWVSGSKPSNYQGKFRCHACDGRTDGRTEESGK